MKKRILLFTSALAIVYLSVSSYQLGPAANSYDCTGSGRNANVLSSCSSGNNCHGSGAGPTVTITLDSAGVPVTQYSPGKTYVINILGTGTSNSWFGFQTCVLKGAGTAQTDAGTLTATAASTHKVNPSAPYVPSTIVEHSTPIHGTAGNFPTSATWVAPVAGTGAVKIYVTLNSVNKDGNANSGDVSTNMTMSVPEEIPSSSSVSSITENTAIKAYPNPFNSQFRLQMNNVDAGNYNVKVYDMSGRVLLNESVELNSSNFETTINTANWAPGFYGLQVLDKNGAARIIPIIKQ